MLDLIDRPRQEPPWLVYCDSGPFSYPRGWDCPPHPQAWRRCTKLGAKGKRRGRGSYPPVPLVCRGTVSRKAPRIRGFLAYRLGQERSDYPNTCTV